MQNAYLFNYFCKCNDTLPRENGQLVTVDVGIDAMSYGGNVDVAIYDPNGSLVSGISTTPTGTAMISYLTFNTSATGMYEVRVVAAAGAPAGTFSVISMTAIVDLTNDKMIVSDLDANVSNDNFLVSLFNVGTTVPVSVVARPGHGYRFGFNGMEKDNDTYGEGNAYDFGARIYDSRLGRWLSLDPLMKKYPAISPFVYTADNPIMYIDPDGRKIIIPNVADREPVLKMINARARGVFGINDKGELFVVQKEGKPGFSEYYRDRLIQGIDEKDVNINIKIGDKVTVKGTYQDLMGKTQPAPDVDIDIERFNGGATSGEEGKDQTITISGKDYNVPGGEKNGVKDIEGKPLKQKAADVLLHEAIGHGIPKALGESKGKDATVEENKAREQLAPGSNIKRGGGHPANSNVK